MQTILLIIFFFLLGAIIFSFPISFKIYIYSNIIENSNFICINFLGFVYICKKISVENNVITITSPNGKSSKLNLSMPTKFQNEFFKKIIHFIGVDFIETSVEFGNKTSAFSSAMITGLLQALFAELNVYLNIKKKSVIYYKISTNYNEDKLTFIFASKFYLSIIQVMVSLIASFLKVLGDKKWIKKKTQ